MRSRLLVCGLLLFGLAGCARRAATSVVLDTAAVEEKKKLAPGGSFAFPKDEGGKMLAEMLPPKTEGSVNPRGPAQPRKLAAPRKLEEPDLSLSLVPAVGDLPHVPVVKDTPTPRPRMLPSEPPLVRSVYAVDVPVRDDLPTSVLVRLPAPDADKAMAVPILALPVFDRASLEDPTSSFSLSAILSAAPPERATPAPPLFLNLPDPFEHHEVVKLRTPPPEDHPPASRP